MCINALCVDDFQLPTQDQLVPLSRPTTQAMVAQVLSTIMPNQLKPVHDEATPMPNFVNSHCHLAPTCDDQKIDPVGAALPVAAIAVSPESSRRHCRGCLNKCQTCENAFCMK
jgi:hypothetical protein